MYSENKRIIITGGPGSGKSTLLDSLSAKGYPTAAKAGRAIIKDQVAICGNALPWKDRESYAELMLNWELRSWHDELFRYSQTVFIAPPWEDIFVQDTERKQSFKEAVQTFHAMVESYSRHGYNLIRLPLCGPEERAEFILSGL